MRNVHVKQKEYQYIVGKGCIVLTLPDGKKHVVSASALTGKSNDAIEKGKWKKTEDGMIKPSDIKAYIEKRLEMNDDLWKLPDAEVGITSEQMESFKKAFHNKMTELKQAQLVMQPPKKLKPPVPPTAEDKVQYAKTFGEIVNSFIQVFDKLSDLDPRLKLKEKNPLQAWNDLRQGLEIAQKNIKLCLTVIETLKAEREFFNKENTFLRVQILELNDRVKALEGKKSTRLIRVDKEFDAKAVAGDWSENEVEKT